MITELSITRRVTPYVHEHHAKTIQDELRAGLAVIAEANGHRVTDFHLAWSDMTDDNGRRYKVLAVTATVNEVAA